MKKQNALNTFKSVNDEVDEFKASIREFLDIWTTKNRSTALNYLDKFFSDETRAESARLIAAKMIVALENLEKEVESLAIPIRNVFQSGQKLHREISLALDAIEFHRNTSNEDLDRFISIVQSTETARSYSDNSLSFIIELSTYAVNLRTEFIKYLFFPTKSDVALEKIEKLRVKLEKLGNEKVKEEMANFIGLLLDESGVLIRWTIGSIKFFFSKAEKDSSAGGTDNLLKALEAFDNQNQVFKRVKLELDEIDAEFEHLRKELKSDVLLAL